MFKKYFKILFENLWIILFSLLLIYSGFQILFFNYIDKSVTMNVYTFDGFEKILGLFPIIIGIGLIYFSFYENKE